MAITNTDEFITYNTFNTIGGIVTSDTFNSWRKKTNGIINEVDRAHNLISNISITNIGPAQLSAGAPIWNSSGALQTSNNGAGSFKAGAIIGTSLNVGAVTITTTGLTTTTGAVNANSLVITGNTSNKFTVTNTGTVTVNSLTSVGVINAVGNVTTTSKIGIGTNTPDSTLHIVETNGSIGSGDTENSMGTITLDHEIGGASSILFRSTVNRGSDAGFIRYQDSDIVGGQGERSRLIIGVINEGSGGGPDYTNVGGDGTMDALILNPNTNNSNCNVGIGTMTPYEKLHVAGNVAVDGTIYADSDIYSEGNIVAFATSDRKFKDNIANITNPLDKVSQINGVSFEWNNQQSTFSGHDIGVIAQEIETILPQIVCTRENGSKAVKYDKLVALLIECVKELKCEIEQLKLLIK